LRRVGIARGGRICFPRSTNPPLEIVGHGTPNKSRRKEKHAVATKESKREAIAVGLALLFVFGAASGFALGVADLMKLFDRALPALVQSHGQPWVSP